MVADGTPEVAEGWAQDAVGANGETLVGIRVPARVPGTGGRIPEMFGGRVAVYWAYSHRGGHQESSAGKHQAVFGGMQ